MIEFLYNRNDSHSKELKNLIPISEKIVLCAAYWRANGLSKISRELVKAAKQTNVKISIFVGLDEKITEKGALDKLLKISNVFDNVEVNACWMQRYTKGPIFHSKVFYFNDGKEFTTIVGSANLTKNGLDHNSESSIKHSDYINTEFDLKMLKYFVELREASYTYTLSSSLIDEYKSWKKD